MKPKQHIPEPALESKPESSRTTITILGEERLYVSALLDTTPPAKGLSQARRRSRLWDIIAGEWYDGLKTTVDGKTLTLEEGKIEHMVTLTDSMRVALSEFLRELFERDDIRGRQKRVLLGLYDRMHPDEIDP